ncbi:MAG: PQQ-binding-like beta-propeller repeat protein [Rhodothermales bacterium]
MKFLVARLPVWIVLGLGLLSLPAVDPPPADWPTNGGTLSNQRYAPLSQIDRTNVALLKGVWHVRLDGSGMGTRFSGEAQPIVHEGTLFIVTGADDVFALDVATGARRWTYEAHLDPNLTGICCGWTSRGVGLGDGMVFVGQLDGKLVALDERTGAVRWSVQAERWQEGYVITSAPLYYDGLVITGFAGAEYAMRGRVKAYDARTGDLVWTFYTIPGPGEIGHETWPQDNELWKYGGGSVWQTPAVDPDLGLLYFSTGNPGPDFSGVDRAGDNLFASSVLALEFRTGAYRWHYQAIHHDLWDYDLPTPVVLFDAEIDGRMRKGLAATGKTGWVYLLDRVTGEPLIGIDERPVPQEPLQATAATQPYPVGDAYAPQDIDIAPEGYDLVNGGRIFTPFLTEGVVMRPSQGGGANWPPSSYDPVHHRYFVCSRDGIGLYRGGPGFDDPPEAGKQFLGGRFGGIAQTSHGIFAAIDVTTNRLVWRQRWSDTCYSGSVATAGGLVFVGRNDGRFTALDTDTGRRLWEFQTGAGVNAPASVFEHDGKEYIAVYAAGNLFAGSERGDHVWLFGLDGALEPVARVDSSVPASTRYADAGPPDPANGRRLFLEACQFCHGETGEGGHNGAPLTSMRDHDLAFQTVTSGRYNMPSFASILTDAERRDVVAYVVDVLNKR